jgi:hypothetical protein
MSYGRTYTWYDFTFLHFAVFPSAFFCFCSISVSDDVEAFCSISVSDDVEAFYSISVSDDVDAFCSISVSDDVKA